MNKLFKACFFLFFLSFKIFAGFAAGTMVKVPGGYQCIERLRPGNIVYSITKSGDCCLSRVNKTTSYFLSSAVLISVGDDVIITALQQKFYDPGKKSWCKAKHVQRSMLLLSGYKNIASVDDIQVVNCEIEFFDIRLEDEHTFFVGVQNIVVHNFPPFFIGFSIAFGGGVSFEGVYLGICIAGLWLGTKLLKRGDDKKYKPKFSISSLSACAGAPDPEEDEEERKKKHPHGRHVDSPKHHQNSKDGIGKPARDGQAALDSSWAVDGKRYRIAVQDGKIIQLMKDGIDTYHGYIVEEWHRLSDKAQKVLLRNGYKINPKTGKLK